MPGRTSDPAVDRLYQLPPNEFTRERNALAKEVGGEGGKRIRALVKPSIPAWAVNQLYWRDRRTHDALVDASERLRAAHRAVLGGRKADLRQADATHRDAVKAALTSTLRLAKDAGQDISPAAHGEIARTLESLPGDEPPGRLSKPLRPGGFEALQGMPISPPKKPADAPKKKEETRAAASSSTEDAAAEARARAAATRALVAARKQEREHRAAVDRLTRRLSQAEQAAARAKDAWEQAQSAERDIQLELDTAQRALDASTEKVREAEGGSQRPGAHLRLVR